VTFFSKFTHKLTIKVR